MQFYEPFLERFAEIATNFKHPDFLWAIPVAVLVILFLVLRNFVKYGLDDAAMRKLRKMRLIVFLLRSLAVTLILIALATPFTTITDESEGNPRALVLIDESASMQLYDTSFTDFLTEELSRRLPTTVKVFGTETDSPVGDATLGHPEHVLLVSDGNANTGVSLEDVAHVARQQNLTINTIELSPTAFDAAVTVDAPRTVPLGFPPQIRVTVTSTNKDPVPLIVSVDGREVYKELATGTVELSPDLTTGYHRIEARITTSDTRAENNAHYRVVEVLQKPKVLVLSDVRGPFETALAGIVDTTVTTSLPQDLSPFTSIVINDRNARSIGNAERIADFLRDEEGGKLGNGLVVVGGFDSFDRGGYQNTQLESLLPVKVGRAKRSLGDNSLVFIIQVSGSTSGERHVLNTATGQMETIRDDVPVVDIIKAQAVSAIESLSLENNVGVIMFGASTAGESFGSAEELIQESVVKIADVKPLYRHKKEIVESVQRVQGGGTTAPDLALRAAVDMLKDKSGSRTIVFLTNGRFSAGLGDLDAGPKSVVENIVRNAGAQYGIKTHIIGVGSSDFDAQAFTKKVDEEYLERMAIRSDGLYDRATNMARLILEYGDPNEKGFGEDFRLVTLSLTHFITRDVELDAILNGYNEVAPKDGSRILVKTDAGDPAVTVWNYFNGRVATVTAFTASGLGPLLEGENSDLVRNTILWSVGDPRRKQAVTVDVAPATVGKETEVTFVSRDPISGACDDTPVAFERSSGDTYVFSFTPQETGFRTVCGIPYAVNHPSEHWRVGTSQELTNAVQITEGKTFTFDQVDEIVEQIRTASKRVTVRKTELRNPFVALALALFLLEIFIRRLTRYTG